MRQRQIFYLLRGDTQFFDLVDDEGEIGASAAFDQHADIAHGEVNRKIGDAQLVEISGYLNRSMPCVNHFINFLYLN